MIKTFNLYVDWVAEHLLHVKEPFKEAIRNSLGKTTLDLT